MNDPTSNRRCLACGTEGSYPTEVTLCPLCAGALEPAPVVADDDRLELLLHFASAQCSVCGMTTLLRRNRQCAGCGADLDEEARLQRDEAVERRRHAFKRLIERFTRRREDSTILQPLFTREGQGISVDDYNTTIFRPTCDAIATFTSDIRTHLRSVTWDPQRDPACVSSLQRVITLLDQSIATALSLANQLPPIEVRAAHRALTRAVGQIIAGYATVLNAIIAVDPDEALKWQQEGQQVFIQGMHTVELLQRIINRQATHLSPGWWMSGDTLDLAAIAWEGIENTPVTIDQAAQLVRGALARIPGVAELDDAEALLLLPATVLPVTIADSVLLQERAGLIRDVLVEADFAVQGWIEDPDELVLRIAEGIRAVNEQVERVGFASTGPSSRRMTIHLLADAYLKLVEGPLRDLGSAVVIAGRAAGGEVNGRYAHEIAYGVQAGDIVQELERLGPSWYEAVLMLLRNASAHAGVRVQDNGVTMTQRRSEGGIVVEEKTVELTDAEFAEEFVRLSESCLALQLGIIPWLFTHQSEHVIRARRDAPQSPQEREGTVRLLAGLQGLLNVAVERDGNILRVQAVSVDGVDASSPNIASLVPAIFHSWADVDSVILHVHPRPPVTYERAELPTVHSVGSDQYLAVAGLMGRKWIGTLSGDAAIVADITYLVQPQINAVFEAFKHANTLPLSADTIAEAHTRLVALSDRMRRSQLPLPGTPLVADVREIVRDAVRCLDRLRWAFMGTDIRERQRHARSYSTLVERLRDIEQKASKEFIRAQAAEKVQRSA